MKFPKYAFLATMIIFIALIVVACGGTSSTPASTPTAASAPTPTPTVGVTPTLTPTTAPSTSSALVRTGTATVLGKSETVLTNAGGKTLYYLTADTSTHVACTGQCTTFWPPLLATAAPTSSTSLPHKLSVLTDANGMQVEYDGHPLYNFSGDAAAGQGNGEGIISFGGTWHVATPGL
jgi:predicted lipoprotein with Yx(FWY)xxD motif